MHFVPSFQFPAFSTEAAGHYQVQVEFVGQDVSDFSVWDSVAEHYTIHHAVPAWHKARIIAEARKFSD